MNYKEFQFAFWHPFGPHSGESAAQILRRKADEVERHGWTLWSFQYRRLDGWFQVLGSVKSGSVLVYCSAGGGSDPFTQGNTAQVSDCASYRFVGSDEWRAVPEAIRVPHTFRPGKTQASAFVVKRVIYPVAPFSLPAVEWLSRDGQWRDGFRSQGHWYSGVPSRGEYLIRPGGGPPRVREVGAVLELQAPYLAMVSHREAVQSL